MVPHNLSEGGLDISFLKNLKAFVSQQAKRELKFVFVVGGGKVSRIYQRAGRETLDLKKNDLDWIGIEVTKLNAFFLAKVLSPFSVSLPQTQEPSSKEIKAFLVGRKKALVSSGWLPGWSTDYDAVKMAELFKQEEIIIAGDAPYVYDKDPKIFSDAKPLKKLTWSDYEKLIPKVWTPGLSTPIDPIATKLAKKLCLTVKTIKGTDLANFKKAIEGEEFEGTVIYGKGK